MSFWKSLAFMLVIAKLNSYCSPTVLKTPALNQTFLEEDSQTNVVFPSTNCAIFKHIDDMTFIEMPHSNENGHQRSSRNAVINSHELWPRGIIPYRISNHFSDDQRRVILQAMRHWEENTCIRFRPKIRQDMHSIFIARGAGCASFVGRLSEPYQPQGVDLGFGCDTFSTVLHELGHVIGFYHEHSRPDRDDYVEVIYDNIANRFEDQFQQIPDGDSNTLEIGYDYASIMHYRRNAFSRNGLDTIQAKDPDIPIGNARELSPLDIAKANALYNCGPSESWPSLSTIVPPEPSLTLPHGFTCGAVIHVTSMGRFRAPRFRNYVHNLDCVWVISVPNGYYVQLEFPPSGIETSAYCVKDWVSIYYGNELSFSNLLVYFCDRRHHAYIITHNVVSVYLHTDNSGGSRRGISGIVTAIDVDECLNNRCHNCTNLPGGFECQCSDGYYHSTAAKTCFDVNECAFDNGGCQHKCVNTGGSYRCECFPGSGSALDDGNRCESSNNQTMS